MGQHGRLHTRGPRRPTCGDDSWILLNRMVHFDGPHAFQKTTPGHARDRLKPPGLGPDPIATVPIAVGATTPASKLPAFFEPMTVTGKSGNHSTPAPDTVLYCLSM